MSSLSENKETGFASIVVALILVLVFSLITLGFATISRREQQNALNQYLASQADYAAESYINQKIKSGLNTTADCETLDYSASVKITCGTVTISPPSYEVPVPITTGKAFVLEVDPAGPAVDKVKISWSSSDTSKITPNSDMNAKNNPSNTDNQGPPILQLSLTPLKDGELTRDCLINKTTNMLIYPNNSTGDAPNLATVNCLVAIPKTSQYSAICVNGNCSISLGNVNSGGVNKFLFHILTPYGAPGITTNVSVVANSASGGGGGNNVINIRNSQAEIDVTARAQDVVKRIKVRVPIRAASGTVAQAPDYIISADSACKRLSINTTKTTPPGTTVISTVISTLFINPPGLPATNNSCNLLNDSI